MSGLRVKAERLWKLAEKAISPPWFVHDERNVQSAECCVCDDIDEDSAAFIAEARTTAPELAKAYLEVCIALAIAAEQLEGVAFMGKKSRTPTVCMNKTFCEDYYGKCAAIARKALEGL